MREAGAKPSYEAGTELSGAAPAAASHGIESNSTNAEVPSDASGSAAPPRSRMGIALLALVGLFIAGYLLLHKLGVTGGPLVCTVGSCETVQSSPWAVFLGLPVPAWGVAGYGLILGVALAGLRPGLAFDRRIAGSLLALAFIAFGFSLYLTALEAFVINAWCQWCVGSAGVATLIFGLSLAELPRLRRR